MHFERIPSMTSAPFCVEPIGQKDVFGRAGVRLEALPCNIKAYVSKGVSSFKTVVLDPFHDQHLTVENFLWPKVFIIGRVRVNPKVKEYDISLRIGEKNYYRFLHHHHPLEIPVGQELEYGLHIHAPSYWALHVYSCDHTGPIEVTLEGLFLREIS